jgi:tetratricopeptide (TPR) repeat protein
MCWSQNIAGVVGNSIRGDVAGRRNAPGGRHRHGVSSALTVLAIYSGLWFCAPGLSTAQTVEAQVAAHFRAGKEALEQGKLDRAVEEFKKVLALHPALFEAEVNLGLAYHSLAEYKLAADYLSRALRQKPNLPGLDVILGIDYLKLGSPAKAIPVLQRAVHLDPSNREAHRALAMCYLSQDNFRKAAQEFRKVSVLDPDKAGAWFKLGHDYLDLSARLAYRGARLYAGSAWGHRFLGDMLVERARWEDAADEYRQALEIEPKQPGLHTSFGQAYLHAGKLERAEEEFRLELQLDAKNQAAWLGVAETQLARGLADPALGTIGQIWAISPEFLTLQHGFPEVELPRERAQALLTDLQAASEGPSKHFLLAGVERALGQTHQGRKQWAAFQTDLEVWQKAQKQKAPGQIDQDPCRAQRLTACANWLQSRRPMSLAQRLQLGKALFMLRQYERAADTLAQLLALAQGNVEASYWLARCYEALGAECFDRLEGSFPQSWRAHQLRAEGYALRGADIDAIKEYEATIQLQPNEAELHEALGELLLNRKAYDEARAQLEQSLALDPSRAQTLCLLGRLYVGKHETEKAVPYLQKALRRRPGMVEASRLLGIAYVRLGQFAGAVPELQKAAPFDFYGDVHYQLSVAYRKLGKVELANRALARSEELRRTSAARHQAMVSGVEEVE